MLINWLIVVTIIMGQSWVIDHYQGKYQGEKKRADTAELNLSQARSTIADMQTRQRDIAVLDAKYTTELADAKATIEDLRDDVAGGKRRLQLNATCKVKYASPSTVGNASTAAITADAERDYWRLRAGIETVTAQVKYLQSYITQQCLK